MALELVDFAATMRHQHAMQQETAGDYDLAALRVDVTSTSNSETGIEREE